MALEYTIYHCVKKDFEDDEMWDPIGKYKDPYEAVDACTLLNKNPEAVGFYFVEVYDA